MGAEGVSGLVNLSANLPDGVDLGEAALAFNAIYSQGKSGKAFSAAKNMELLSPEQRQYAYNLGIMDKVLDGVRAKNAAAEISGENDGKVLQKDGVGDTIKENEQGDINSEQQKAERAEAQFAFDGGAESRTFESTSGTRTEDEDRSRVQGEDRGTSQKVGGALTSDRRINRLNPKEINVDLSDTLQIDKEHLLYEPQQKLINEYGIECYIIKERSWHRSSPAGTYKGKVYMSEIFSGNLLATVVPHEATHAMKQLNYQPYLDLIDRLPDMLDMSAEATEDMFNWIAGHCGFDFLAMSRSEGMHFYDEMNAAIYGFYKTSMWESDGYAEWVPNAFYDFDSYIAELEAIHEQFKKDIQARKVESYKQVDSTTSDVQQAKSDQASSSEWDAERIKDGKVEKAKPISEIIERIRHDFGIHITKGHVRGKGVLGQYSRKNHGIRTKIANDLPTVAHELGHALDQRYSLTDKSKLTKEMRSELINALGDLKDSYKQNLWVSEGFAEYLRRFLQNRDDATRSYPEFTKHFLNSLSKADRVLMDTFADEINAYYALDADTATSSIRLREEGTPDARTALEKAKEMGDGVYQAWVDANHGIRLFDEATGGDTYKLAANAAYSDAIAGQIITGDLTDANGQYVRILTVSSLERESLQVTKLIGVSKDKFESKYGTKKERDTGSLRGQTDKTDIPNPSTKAQHTAGALSTISIPQEKGNVNKKISTNSENAKSDAWSKVDEIIESTIDDVLVQYGQGKAHGDVVTVLRDGKEEFWKINDPKKLNSLDVEFNKKNRVIVAQFASKEAIANTPHSPRFNNSIPPSGENVNRNFSTNSEMGSHSISTMLEARFGPGVNDYLNTFIKDLNGAKAQSGGVVGGAFFINIYTMLTISSLFFVII